MTWASSEPFLSEKHPSFLIQEPGKIYEKGGNSTKTGLTKKQKTTELYFNAKDPMAEIYTHDTKLKRRLLEYAATYPHLCQLTEDDEQGGLRFEIAKDRISIRLTAPYTEERKSNARKWAKENGLRGKYDGQKREKAGTRDEGCETLRN